MTATLLAPASFATVVPEAAPRFAAESAIFELESHISNLRLGLFPYNVLTPAERAEQLLQLVDTDSFIPVAEHVAQLSDERLMELVSDSNTPNARFLAAARELTARVDAVPTPSERRRIESEDEDYHRQLTLDREAESAEYTLDTPLHGRTFASVG